MCEVSEAQGAPGSTDKQGSTAGGSFPGSQQPYNRLGWNADVSGSTKEKQEQVL